MSIFIIFDSRKIVFQHPIVNVFGKMFRRSAIFLLVYLYTTHARVLHAAIFLLIFPMFFYALKRRPFFCMVGYGRRRLLLLHMRRFFLLCSSTLPIFVPLAMYFVWVFGISNGGGRL